MIFVNFKLYPEASGDNAVRLAVACETVSEQTQLPIIPIVSSMDAWRVKQHVTLPVWIQHIDPFEPGPHTGYTSLEAAVTADLSGTILNHSEHTTTLENIKTIIERKKSLDHTFEVMVCAPDINVLRSMKEVEPNYLSYEPPELIGSDSESVASKKADVITAGVENAGDIPLVVGAGIKTKDDVVASLRRGAKGILVSSSVVKAEKPEEKLLELASAFKSY